MIDFLGAGSRMGAALGGNNQLSGEIGSAEEKIGRTIIQKFAKEPGSHLPGFFLGHSRRP